MNMLKIAPLSPPSVMERPMAKPARMLVSIGCTTKPASMAARARKDAPRERPREPRPHAALEKKFMFNAAPSAARIEARELQPMRRKKTHEQRPRISALVGQ